MEYGKLGNTDIEVSKLCVGCMSFGKAGTMHDWTLDEAESENVIKHALDLGYNFFDTANAYVNERAVGRAIKDSGIDRKNIFLSTKIWASEYENENAVEETLERLGVDYVDLLYIHQPAGNWLAGYRMLEKAYREGKAKSIGISNDSVK